MTVSPGNVSDAQQKLCSRDLRHCMFSFIFLLNVPAACNKHFRDRKQNLVATFFLHLLPDEHEISCGFEAVEVLHTNNITCR